MQRITTALPPLQTVPGQDAVPLMFKDCAALLVVSFANVPDEDPEHPDTPLKWYEGGTPGVSISKGACKTQERGSKNLRSSVDTSDAAPAGITGVTDAHRKAFQDVYEGLVGSLEFGVEGNCDSVKVTFTPNELHCDTNVQIGAAFEKYNAYKWSGEFLKVGGTITLSGTMPPGEKGLTLTWKNKYNEFTDDLGKQYSFATSVYLMKLQCPPAGAEIWTSADMKAWPAHELEEYRALCTLNPACPVMYGGILKMATWRQWRDDSHSTWHLEGQDTEPLTMFCGPEQPDKHTNEGSQLFPVVHDVSGFEIENSNDDTPGSGSAAASASDGTMHDDRTYEDQICSEFLVVKGSIGDVTYNHNDHYCLWNGCYEGSVNAICFGVYSELVMPIALCAVCLCVKEAMLVGPCGHTMCTGCHAKMDEHCINTCSLCRGVKIRLTRTAVYTSKTALQHSAASAARSPRGEIDGSPEVSRRRVSSTENSSEERCIVID